ncbi:putative secondary metabolism biosynthetic enzyme [Aspergillus pseudoviridinutans]|uniref:Aromatic prenyltransferase n=1 Tax=Aspergillus pseudoviridinutans TaxID=1517512 RepID=A0A9P3BMB0_9EURO|nr:putative secondary metabolism biosynthetic enzyme [Aspergillus pseudoviridinutans]GIJ90336.1 putative secondary metabolism biosynthetic enzyme [Aspergillus pseudoviridinutans]
MIQQVQQAVFDPKRFLVDIQETCRAIGAPLSQEITLKVLETFQASFARGAVLWRTTDLPGDALNFRFYERVSIDAVSCAVNAKLLQPNHPLSQMIVSWSSLYSGAPQQSCDFDTKRGLTKIWVYLGDMRPLGDILSAPHVPLSIRNHAKSFYNLGLKIIRHVAADFTSNTVNIYFRAHGPLTLERARSLVGLADPTYLLTREEVEEMRRFLNPVGFTFAVTMDYTTGEIKRVGVYALKLAPGTYPPMDERLKIFFTQAPSHDEEEMNAIAWSFGKGGARYVKAERSYCGGLVPLMRQWNSAMSS